ncbi:hypothetical protein A4X09_0g7681 [Tilletia walkeri]|uniref:Uncharacterized protein n=1 Tax=Tilletia walkeri TaxID=117179 RepID=A0A8X7T144_9BASI|nr:hypothetical protein A4X09_0g7681 [Tilletia walkeri]
MYDADLAFIRRVEVYRSSSPGVGVRVYFLMPDVPKLGRGTATSEQPSTGEGRIREADQRESVNGVASASGRETCGGRR